MDDSLFSLNPHHGSQPEDDRMMQVKWLILGAAGAMLAGGCGAVPDQATEPTLPLPPRTPIVRVYYDDLATRNAAEGYHILKATDEDIARLLAAGLRVEKDDNWTGPGSFAETPPEEATPTAGPTP